MSESQEQTRAPLVFQVTLGASPDEAFRTFFETPERWLCRSGGFDLRAGGGLRLCWADGCVTGRVAQYEPPRTGRFSWRFEGDPLPETMVVVGFQPTQRAGSIATLVEVEHYGFGAGRDWEPAYLGTTRAWAGYLKNLRAMVDAGLDLREPNE